MSKSSKPQKEKPSTNSINVDGDVSNSVLIAGNKNNVTIQLEALKTTYGLFTIPQPVTDFTGREAELVGLKASFTNGAIITGLSGAGGIGKTELARKLAYEIAENFPDAQINIDLLGTSEKPTSSEDAMRRLLEPFHLGQKLPDDEAQLKGLYQQTFGKKKVLLLLDNATNAAQVRPLIPPAPSSAIITSRQHFSLSEFGLHEPLRLNVLSPEKALEFLRGASYKLQNDSVDEINNLSALCGRLPLALRIVVSILNENSDWSLAALLNRLQDERTRLAHLKREDDDDFNVEATLTLSYNLLSIEAQKSFRFLGIFSGQFFQGSAFELWGNENDEEYQSILSLLVRRNLLNYSPFPDGKRGLYYFHDLTRIFAVNKLLESEEEAKFVLEKASNHFLALASNGSAEVEEGIDKQKNIDSFNFYWPDLYLCWQRLSGAVDWYKPSLATSWLSKFPSSCFDLLNFNIPSTIIVPILLEAVNSAQRDGNEQLEMINSGNLGVAYKNCGDLTNAIDFHKKNLLLAKKIEDSDGESSALGNLGNAYAESGDLATAIYYLHMALEIHRKQNDLLKEIADLSNISAVYLKFREFSEANVFIEKCLNLLRQVNAPDLEVTALANLGSMFLRLGYVRRAIGYLEQSVVVQGRSNTLSLNGVLSNNLGIAYELLGDFHSAIHYIKQSVEFKKKIQSPDLNETLKRLEELENTAIEKEGLLTGQLLLEEYTRQVINAAYDHGPNASNYFEEMNHLAIDSSIQDEVQELAKVLRQILVGNYLPNLSNLPDDFKDLVADEIARRSNNL